MLTQEIVDSILLTSLNLQLQEDLSVRSFSHLYRCKETSLSHKNDMLFGFVFLGLSVSIKAKLVVLG
jgi:hypothetical protein